jgi:excisionase family DNA binding protein
MSTSNVSKSSLHTDKSGISDAVSNPLADSYNLMQSGQDQIEPLPEWPLLRVVKVCAQNPDGVPCPPVRSALHQDINDLGNKRARKARQMTGRLNCTIFDRGRSNRSGTSAGRSFAEHPQEESGTTGFRKKPVQRDGRVDSKIEPPLADAAVDLATRIQRRRKALTVGELADMLALSQQQIYNLAQRGNLPSIRIASSVRFDPASTAQWIRSKTA